MGWFDRELTKRRRDAKQVFDFVDPSVEKIDSLLGEDGETEARWAKDGENPDDKLLEALHVDVDGAGLLPEEPVKEGAEWSAEGSALCALLYHGLAFLRTVILFSDTQENDNGRYIITSSGILSSNQDANNDWPRMNGREAERIYNSVMWATVIAFAMVFGTVRQTMNGHSSSSSSL